MCYNIIHPFVLALHITYNCVTPTQRTPLCYHLTNIPSVLPLQIILFVQLYKWSLHVTNTKTIDLCYQTKTIPSRYPYANHPSCYHFTNNPNVLQLHILSLFATNIDSITFCYQYRNNPSVLPLHNTSLCVTTTPNILLFYN